MKKNNNEKRIVKTGNEAAAEAMRQINPDVVAAYPITPATEIVQIFSQFAADGKVKTEFVPVESEHSAMSAATAASAAGGRAMTATSSQGLALMHEVLYVAAGLRLPVVMPVVNRTLSAPINIHCDHSDTMGERDSGWLQIYSENAQEVYDNIIQAVRIAEKVRLPAMVCFDGFITSHCLEGLELLSDREVKGFIGEYKPKRFLLDTDHPYTLGALDLQDYYFEHKRQEAESMRNAYGVVEEISKEFERKFSRSYGFFEEYMMNDAEMALVGIGSFCGTAKAAVNELRQKGIKAGLVKVRVFRPFPFKEIAKSLGKVKAVAVMDRIEPMSGFGGPLFNEIRSALYDFSKKPKVVNYIYGLGGRDIFVRDVEKIFMRLKKQENMGQLVSYIGARE